jgi:WD40 repeat protein
LAVWSVKNKKLELDLPGHADEVFAVDWSPDGQRVASGGKDKVLKMYDDLLTTTILLTLFLLLSGGKINKLLLNYGLYITNCMVLFIDIFIARIASIYMLDILSHDISCELCHTSVVT